MNAENLSRRLRLERLESRSMLAAGIFDSTMDTDQDRTAEADRDSSRPSVEARQASVEARQASVEARQDSRAGQQSGSVGRSVDGQQSDRVATIQTRARQDAYAQLGRQSVGRGDLNVDPGQNRVSNRVADRSNVGQQADRQAQTSVPSPAQAAVASAITSDVVITVQISRTPTTTSSSDAAARVRDLQSDSVGTVSVRRATDADAGATNLVSVAGSDESDEATGTEASGSDLVVSENASADVADDATSFLAAEATDDGSQASSFADAGDAISDRSDSDSVSSNEGWIDLSPLRSLMPTESTESSSETDRDLSNQSSASEPRSWRLQRETLPQLQRLAEGSDLQRASDSGRLFDDWLDGPGGMIALDRVTLPPASFALDGLAVDVQLESTVMLHRSLDWVASGTKPALSGPVLDAIMASLEGVVEQEHQPITQASNLQVPTAAYPAVAIAATTVAISNRRKHKTPDSNMQATGKKPT
ncbi:hypothetical protein [Neorhodopirellula lusitana]|uniref:hypothetical protein n=1 Tax=Neorhodopirellula lusitana TaxID=445327 RepID=UPI00384FC202